MSNAIQLISRKHFVYYNFVSKLLLLIVRPVQKLNSYK